MSRIFDAIDIWKDTFWGQKDQPFSGAMICYGWDSSLSFFWKELKFYDFSNNFTYNLKSMCDHWWYIIQNQGHFSEVVYFLTVEFWLNFVMQQKIFLKLESWIIFSFIGGGTLCRKIIDWVILMKGVYIFSTLLYLPPVLLQLYIFEPISKIVQRFWVYSFFHQISDKITHIFKDFPFSKFWVLSGVRQSRPKRYVTVCVYVFSWVVREMEGYGSCFGKGKL